MKPPPPPPLLACGTETGNLVRAPAGPSLSSPWPRQQRPARGVVPLRSLSSVSVPGTEGPAGVGDAFGRCRGPLFGRWICWVRIHLDPCQPRALLPQGPARRLPPEIADGRLNLSRPPLPLHEPSGPDRRSPPSQKNTHIPRVQTQAWPTLLDTLPISGGPRFIPETNLHHLSRAAPKTWTDLSEVKPFMTVSTEGWKGTSFPSPDCEAVAAHRKNS